MSPFKSEKQRRFLWFKHPDIAREWSDKYGDKVKGGKNGKRTIRRKKGNRGSKSR